MYVVEKTPFKDLIDQIALRSGISHILTEAIIKEFLEELKTRLLNGEVIDLGFITIYLTVKKSKNGYTAFVRTDRSTSFRKELSEHASVLADKTHPSKFHRRLVNKCISVLGKPPKTITLNQIKDILSKVRGRYLSEQHKETVALEVADILERMGYTIISEEQDMLSDVLG